jgi:beta-phosphoglucomutase-like phosphatase (HAD superfamily)
VWPIALEGGTALRVSAHCVAVEHSYLGVYAAVATGMSAVMIPDLLEATTGNALFSRLKERAGGAVTRRAREAPL